MSETAVTQQLPKWLADRTDLGDLGGVLAGDVTHVPTTAPADTSHLDSVPVPSDAGQWADGLKQILRRIPDGWARHISCGPGWYQLLVELDQMMAAIEPGYELYQVKEKFGGLRYYWDLPELPCCQHVNEQIDGRLPPQPPAGDQEAWKVWNDNNEEELLRLTDELFEQHEVTNQHQAAAAARETNTRMLDHLVAAAEAEAARTCEHTGNPGMLMSTAGGWMATLDPTVADARFVNIHAGIPKVTVERHLTNHADDPDKLRKFAEHLAKKLNYATHQLNRMRNHNITEAETEPADQG